MRIIKYSTMSIVMVSMFCVAHGMCDQGKFMQFPDKNPYPVPEIRYKEASLYADFFENQFFDRVEQYFMVYKVIHKLFCIEDEAPLVNAYDEVPDSPFFTNRNGKQRLSIDVLKKGADVNTGPDVTKPWAILKGKVSGVSPGFVIKDSHGDRYIIKIDGKEYPEMSSSSEVIASKFIYAIGYNVPQYTICYFKPDILTVDPQATYYDKNGFKKVLTHEIVLEMLQEKGFRNRDGNYRASASKYIDGKLLGYCSFRSHRKQDALDPVAHENRREMRGLYVFSSWLNHHDMRRGNMVDTLIEDEDGWYIKHYLIDFAGCFGSHSTMPKYASAGHQNVFDVRESIRALLTLGLYPVRPYYREAKTFSPAIGYFTSDTFEPNRWKPMIANFAFDNMTKRDAQWAAKIVMSFTDEQIAALVATGELSDPEDRAYLTRILIERRDIIGQYWLKK